MVLRWTLLFSLLLSGFALPEKRTYSTHNYYVIRHDPTAPSGAPLSEVIETLGVEFVEQAGELRDHWLVKQRRSVDSLVSRESVDPVLSAFEALKSRAASPLFGRSEDVNLARRVASSVDYLSLQTLRQRVKRAPPPVLPPSVEAPTHSHSKIVADQFQIRDPEFSKQWHIVNDEFPEHMMNVSGVWEMGLTGKGIISSFIDDGLEYESDDLAANFDADDSYDYNDHVALPTPKNYDDHHGTRCAGQVAAIKNNVCGVGLAYDSRVAGVRILSGPISDVDEAAALNYGYQNVSIYSCSWGPPDNGASMEGPNYLIKKALVNGINHGRGGKGSIFVFASGNGAARGDQCNFDGYTNSIYSVTVSAVDYQGLHPYYSEPCAANMVVAYSSGSGQHITTTDKGTATDKNACSSGHGGTSAAAPNAVGVFALALEARPDLTWRDIQHLCVQTATEINPEDLDWEPIANGKKYSYKYGFGVLDGFKYVTAAKTWTLVKPQAWFATKTVQLNDGKFGTDEKYVGGEFIPPAGIESKMEITKDELERNNLETLEHINVKVWIQHASRGEVEVEILSPGGVKSVLGGARPSDKNGDGYPGWTFMSVKHWGEDPIGTWTLKVKDQNKLNSNGTFLGWSMVFWGSSIDPAKTTKYEVPLIEYILPPPETPHPTVSVTSYSTTQHSKPTAHLPGDHGIASGEKSKPAFTSTGLELSVTSSARPSSTSISSAPDLGWFSDMGNLVASQKWVFGALGVVSVFGIGVGIFFWKRRQAQTSSYQSLNNGEGDMNMSAMGTSMLGPRTTRELYDAFGEVSDDDDDANETTALRQPLSRGVVGFHSGFLDDDASAAVHTSPSYHDEPKALDDGPTRKGSRLAIEREGSTTESTGSGEGSWEHASRDSH
ncbi:peptidase S8/S53 domain-containing protein [Crepidotus variabilis]|uniref:Peptidase S8/S53 domain-containing protein n=1 Tax=Crepidotus variabilis TaxID=179855 RepID=A0A9P6JWP2_9AGAR|nr:peptidase S8/S53 domain-containing protein [Crepidotus variabilis]